MRIEVVLMLDENSGFDLRLMEKMAERGLTQADLCRHTELASSMISHYCTGQRIPSVPVAVKIAKALNTTVDYLAYGKPEKTRQPFPDAHTIAEKTKDYALKHPESEQIDDEASLINMFRSLNSEGKAKVISYTKDMLSIDMYRPD